MSHLLFFLFFLFFFGDNYVCRSACLPALSRLSPLALPRPPLSPLDNLFLNNDQALSCIAARIAKDPFFHAVLLSPPPLLSLLLSPVPFSLGPHPPPPGVITMILSPGFIAAVFFPPRLMICSCNSSFSSPSHFPLITPSTSSPLVVVALLLRFLTHKFTPHAPSSPPASPYG